MSLLLQMMRECFKVIFVGVVILILPIKGFAKKQESQIFNAVKIQRINSPVKIDGLSDESAWDSIQPFPMTMHRPVFGNEPTEYSEILLGYNDYYLYAAGRFYDREPDKIQSPYKKRDNIGQASDWFWLALDTFNDNENALLFMTAPSGLRVDCAVFNDGVGDESVNMSWNTFWDVETVKNGNGWFAEMRIPFSSLRFEERNGKVVMGLIVGRWIARIPEIVLYPAIPYKWGFWSLAKPSKMQDIIISEIHKRKSLYITPYSLCGLGYAKKLNDEELKYEKDENEVIEIGLDVKYGLSSNLTLDITLNPDFAQVEADEQQVNLTRYSLFFPEKRLFFQERSSNFDFNFGENNCLFHSRNIGLYNNENVRIYDGARIVGRIGPWDVGFINMQTERNKDLPSENFGVLRIRKQMINNNSYVGGILTSRIGTDNNWNIAYGFDSVLRLYGNNDLKFNWAQSFECYKGNNIFSLEPARIRLSFERYIFEGLGYNIEYSRAGKDYFPGIGYEQRRDFTKLGDLIWYGWTPSETSLLLRHYFYLGGYKFIRNSNGSTESSTIGCGWNFLTKSNYSFDLSFTINFEDVDEQFDLSDNCQVNTGQYTYYNIKGSFNTPSSQLTNITTALEAGSFYDGNRISLSFNPMSHLTSAIEISGKYQVNMIDFADRKQKFNSHVVTFRLLTMFSTKHSLTSLIQYNNASKQIISNIRYRYNPREGNDFYVVYDEDFNTDRYREVPTLPHTNNRTILIKYSYTFNKQL